MTDFPKTDRNKVKRIPKRGHYDKKTIYEILDSAFIAHVGFIVNGQPFVIPTAYGRDGDTIYAVIQGVGTSSDGSGTAVYAPVSEGQAQAIGRAYRSAAFDPATIELIEAHAPIANKILIVEFFIEDDLEPA